MEVVKSFYEENDFNVLITGSLNQRTAFSISGTVHGSSLGKYLLTISEGESDYVVGVLGNSQ